jgi:hypothetical protein
MNLEIEIVAQKEFYQPLISRHWGKAECRRINVGVSS